jgi:glycosyltransferase involved in cell wall biosynthesis
LLPKTKPELVAARMIAWPTPLLCRFAEPDLRARIAQCAAAIDPQALHIMRLYLVPYMREALVSIQAKAVLDLDEDDVQANERLSALYARHGDAMAAQLASRESARYDALRIATESRFARLLVASDADPRRLGVERFSVFPNGIRIPEPAPSSQDGPVLFVGTLGYAPNEDAVLHLITQILPRLRAASPDLRLRIVGPGASERLRAKASAGGAELAGPVQDLSAEYSRARLVVIPLLAGGGTRIKLLEALAYQRPVVSTTIGAEGLSLVHGKHALIADTAPDFAAACLALLDDPARALRLGTNGRALVKEHYSIERLAEKLAAVYRTLYALPSGGTER